MFFIQNSKVSQIQHLGNDQQNTPSLAIRHILNLTITYIVCDHSPPLILFKVSLNLSELKMATISNIIKKGQRSKYTAFPLSLVTLISAWINGIFKWVTRISIAKQYMCNIPELPLSHAIGIKVFCYTSYSKLTKNQFIIGWNWFYLIVNSCFFLLKVFIYITN